jgi:hypothetical protein
MLAERGYDAGWFGRALRRRRIIPYIPPKKSSQMTELLINTVRKPNTCAAGLKIGAEFILDVVVAPIYSFLQDISPTLSNICHNTS